MKETKLRESLNRLLNEHGDPAQVDRVISKLTGQREDLSVPDRLWVLRRRLEELKGETEDLSSLLEYHSGSRLSQVIDHLTEAVSLTEETMNLTTSGQASGLSPECL